MGCVSYNMCMSNGPNNLVLEHLKKLQADVSDIKRDVRDVKANNSMLLSLFGELVKANARDDEHFAHLETRIERIESRLNLNDA